MTSSEASTQRIPPFVSLGSARSLAGMGAAPGRGGTHPEKVSNSSRGTVSRETAAAGRSNIIDAIDDSSPIARELAHETKRRERLVGRNLPRPEDTRIFTVSNQKGGVGKTTSAWMLARQWAALDQRVLLVDLDPQAHLTAACGLAGTEPTIGDVLTRIIEPKTSQVTLKQAANSLKDNANIRCVPSSLDLENVALNLQQSFLHTITALHSALAADGPDLNVEIVLIDCPPSAGVLTLNALIAADSVLIPSSPEPWDIDGVRKMLDVVRQVQERRDGLPAIAGIVATKTDERTVQHQQGLQMLHALPAPVIGQIDRRNGVDAEAQILAGYAPVARAMMEVVP